jgi:Pyruvate/2-oxoacid:ferredoxin oxidoreductase delta subunit
MAEIISIDKKRVFSDKEKAAAMRKRKILAVRKAFQCTQCRIKCEKCGAPIEGEPPEQTGINQKLRVPYRFCLGCADEYIDFIERLKGDGDPDYYWHNESWIKSWQAWIEYRSALDQHAKSNEFFRLIKDLEQNETNQ